MLLWQQRNMRKQRFLMQLLLVIAIFHLLVLLLFLYAGKQSRCDMAIFLDREYKEADILFMPFIKEVKQVAVMPKQSKRSVAAASPVRTTTIKEDRPIKPDKQQEIKKPEVAPQATSAEPKQPEKKQVVQDASKQREEKAEPSDTPPICLGSRQFNEFKIQQAIAHELKRTWAPPAGFASDLEMIVVVFIDEEGHVSRLQTKKESGVLVYDIHARSALYAMRFPKDCWGRQVTISFKQ